jgi:hypothetical protein
MANEKVQLLLDLAKASERMITPTTKAQLDQLAAAFGEDLRNMGVNVRNEDERAAILGGAVMALELSKQFALDTALLAVSMFVEQYAR